MGKSIQLRDKSNEKCYPHPYYPVGSIYLSVNDTNPSRWFGGTWVQIAKGRTLVGVDTNDTDFNTVQKTGGSKTHKHPLSSLGGANIRKYADKFIQGKPSTAGSFPPESSGHYWLTDGNGDYSSTTKPYVTDMAGIGLYGYTDAQNNLPPYFTCYIWCRTA